MTQIFIDIYGWRGAMLLLSGLNLHVMVAAAVLKPIKTTKLDGFDYHYLEEPNKYDKKQDRVDTFCGVICSCVKDIFSISLFKNGSFIIILIVTAFSDYAHNGWIVYLVSISKSKGLVESEAVMIASVSGAGALVIRIIMAVFMSKTSWRTLLYIGSLLIVLSYLGMFFATSFLTLSFPAFVLGVGLGITGALMYVATYAVVGEEEAINAVAWVNVVFGVGYMISGCVTGKFILPNCHKIGLYLRLSNIFRNHLKNQWTGRQWSHGEEWSL